MKWWPTYSKRGDMIRVKCGSVYHYGIFVSETEIIQFGRSPAYGDKERRVLSTDISEFSRGGVVETMKLGFFERLSRIPPEKTVKLAREIIGEGGYDIVKNNCEHFAYRCVFGKSYSEQSDKKAARMKGAK